MDLAPTGPRCRLLPSGAERVCESDWSRDTVWVPISPPTPTAGPTPTAPPTATPVPQTVLQKPNTVELVSQPKSTGKTRKPGHEGVRLEEHAAGLFLDWPDVPGDNVKYIVEKKRRRVFGTFGDWEPLPYDVFTIDHVHKDDLPEGVDAHLLDKSEALIYGLKFNQEYKFHIMAVDVADEDNNSGWSDTYTAPKVRHFLGQQADHTVQYVI